MPEAVEVRARAFAAELLLPRALAAEAFRSSHGVEHARPIVASRFGISSEIFAWQVKNSGVHLDDREMVQLRRLVSRPSAFR
jgi:Zn-dependent peptidase ImmA (M78 family)